MTHYNRRTETEACQIGDYYSDISRYYDQNFGLTVVKLISGDCYSTSVPDEMMVTILGSCISACMRDPVAKVAGMNHFLLPGDGAQSLNMPGDAARYGAFAMEKLINGLIGRGARKERLEIKLFGGGNVIDNSAMIGSRNVDFVLGFLDKEGMPVASSDLGGDAPRRIHYFASDGRVMLRRLKRKEDMRILVEEKAFASSLVQKPVGGDIELFD